MIGGKNADSYQILTDLDNSKHNLINEDDGAQITNYHQTLNAEVNLDKKNLKETPMMSHNISEEESIRYLKKRNKT